LVDPPAGGLLSRRANKLGNMKYYCYAIFNSERNKIYIGQTGKLKERLERHNGKLKNKSKSFTSKNSGEWKLIYQEEVFSREEAIKREKQLKSFKGREFIRNLIDKK
jgi:putative endonuclease